jgi:uncharacterized Zn-binding protein involved in type VI secretion
MLAVAVSALVADPGCGGAAAAAVGAGVASSGGEGITVRDVTPRSIGGTVAVGSPRTLMGASGLPAALSGAEPVDCHRHRDNPIRTGAATVFVDGMRLARAFDETKCGSKICDGEKTVLVGGPPADGAPADPLAVISRGAALASVAVGNALGAAVSPVEAASRWSEAIAGSVGSAAESAAQGMESGVGAAGAEVGALLGCVETGLLGPLLGKRSRT